MCGGKLDHEPAGVKTSTISRRCAANSGGRMWLIWRVALPEPRISIATSSTRTWAIGPHRSGSASDSQNATSATPAERLDGVRGARRQVDGLGHAVERRLAAAAGLDLTVAGRDEDAPGDHDDRDLAILAVLAHRLLELPPAERQEPPAGALGRDRGERGALVQVVVPTHR